MYITPWFFDVMCIYRSLLPFSPELSLKFLVTFWQKHMKVQKNSSFSERRGNSKPEEWSETPYPQKTPHQLRNWSTAQEKFGEARKCLPSVSSRKRQIAARWDLRVVCVVVNCETQTYISVVRYVQHMRVVWSLRQWLPCIAKFITTTAKKTPESEKESKVSNT